MLEPTLIDARARNPLAPGPAVTPGQQIGPYRIDQPIGRGGMAEVWLASRGGGRFQTRYAVKFLSHPTDHPSLAERFLQEGLVLSRLRHPNIVRLIDTGTTAEGRRYLVLEYVDGECIDRHCNRLSLDLRARILLFMDVARAIAHSHAHLIVHRDLKPSNVLVTRDGVVKLLDFGIAKLLEDETAPTSPIETGTAERLLSPEYAAPEQLLGEPPSTATDVYQLGMMLFMLITGRHPLRHFGPRTAQLRAVFEGRIPLASRICDPMHRAQLRGSLDSIIAKSLRADIDRRYRSAAELVDELQCYLDDGPILKRYASVLYCARKVITRILSPVFAA